LQKSLVVIKNMLVIILLWALLFAYGLALPTEDHGSKDGYKDPSSGGGAGSGDGYSAASADCAEMIYYAQFTGSAACGIFVFKESGSGVVSVETVGDGISGLDPSGGPYPYHSIPPLSSSFLTFVQSPWVVWFKC
jgi:hypothetical protein